MVLFEYLKLRGGKALTVAGAKAIGVDASKKGWAHRHRDAVVPPELVAIVEEADRNLLRSTARKVNRRMRCRNFKKTLKAALPEFVRPRRPYVAPPPAFDYNFIVSAAFLSSYEWRRLRYQVLSESDGKCQCCGRSKEHGVVLHVDHIKSRRKCPELALVKSNCQVLCEDCNHGKGNTERDWRTP